VAVRVLVDADDLRDQDVLVEALGGGQQFADALVLRFQRYQLLQPGFEDQLLLAQLTVLGQQGFAAAQLVGGVAGTARQAGQPDHRRQGQRGTVTQAGQAVAVAVGKDQRQRTEKEGQCSEPQARATRKIAAMGGAANVQINLMPG
jgi:ribosomal protein L21E